MYCGLSHYTNYPETGDTGTSPGSGAARQLLAPATSLRLFVKPALCTRYLPADAGALSGVALLETFMCPALGSVDQSINGIGQV